MCSAVLDLKTRRPRITPRLSNHRASEANELLSRGVLDVAFYYDALTHEGLSIERLGAATSSVYCGRGHPLFRVARPPRREILKHEFSVPEIGDKGSAMDNWPVDIPRRVGMRSRSCSPTSRSAGADAS